MFKKGDRVKRTLHGIGGYTEETFTSVAKVEGNTVYVYDENGTDVVTGVTFNNVTGRELENFFLPMYSEIKKVEE